MQPLAMFLGIVMGSTVSIAVGLAMTVIVFLFLPEYSERLSGEFGPLLSYFAATSGLAAIAVAAFVGEVRSRSWRRGVQSLLALALLAVFAWYWLNWRAAAPR